MIKRETEREREREIDYGELGLIVPKAIFFPPFIVSANPTERERGERGRERERD